MGVSDNEDVLINMPLQAAAGYHNSSSGGKMNVIVQGSKRNTQRREIPYGGFRPALFSAGNANSHGMEFHVHQQFVNTDKEEQDAGFDSDSEIVPFFDVVNGENAEEAYEEEIILEGLVLEYGTAAVNKNPIANATVDVDKNVDVAEHLPSVDDSPPAHFISKYELDKMELIDLREILKSRVLSIPGKKTDLWLRLHQTVATGVKII